MSANPDVLFKEILKSGISLRVKVTGKSMEPSLYSGNTVILQPVLLKTLHVGELIFFHDACHKILLHRIVRKIKKNHVILFQTKGDALPWLDAPVAPEQILGKVVEIERQHPGSGRRQIINLESPQQRVLNGFLARFHLLKAAVPLVLKRVLRVLSHLRRDTTPSG